MFPGSWWCFQVNYCFKDQLLNPIWRDRSRHQSYQSESDMIEHTDALGRTSYISKKELSLVREKDREMADLTRDDYDERYSRYSDGSRSPSPENKQAR